MQGLIIVNEHDVPHLVALLKRHAVWGMLTYYDMDAIFAGLEELTHRMFMCNFRDAMNWPGFMEFLDELTRLPDDPMQHAHALAFMFLEPAPRLLDYVDMQDRIGRHGTP